jgi:hypothetical protein
VSERRRREIEFDRKYAAHRAAVERTQKLLRQTSSVDPQAVYLEEVDREERLAAAARLKRLVNLVVGWPRGLHAIHIQQVELKPVRQPGLLHEAEMTVAKAFGPKEVLDLAAKDELSEREIETLENSVAKWVRSETDEVYVRF